MITKRYVFAALICLLQVTVMHVATGQAETFDKQLVLRASELVPSGILRSDRYTVDENVINDGYLNTYTIRSDYGIFKAVSTPMLYIRLHEIDAIAAIDKVDLTEEFGTSAVEGGEKLVDGAIDLLSDPIGSLQDTFSGVATAFGRAQENILESSPSAHEDSRAKNLIGFSKVKREYALKFKVDPYSTNQVLQKKLEDLAWAGYSGGLGFGAVGFVLTGPVSVAFSALRGTELLKEVDLSVAPTDLRRQNREKLLRMGVNEDIARVFINNAIFSPTQQTYLVAALEGCRGVGNIQKFIAFSASTSNSDLAFFRQRMAAMYLDYHKQSGGLDRFIAVEEFIAAVTKGGEMLLCFPFDYCTWTHATATILGFYDMKAKKMGLQKQIFVAGSLSTLARKNMQARGWQVREMYGQ